MPAGRMASIPGFEPSVTMFNATLSAVLLGLSLRMVGAADIMHPVSSSVEGA